MLEFNKVSKYFAEQVILEQASFRILAGERVGIVGPNGAGKSTVFSLINGQTESDKGDVFYPKNLRVGHLRQQLNPQSVSESLLDYVLAGAAEVTRLHQQISETETALAETSDDKEPLLKRLGTLEEQFQHLGGYDVQHRSEAALSGLGFDEASFSRPFQEFSGGWQMRAELARTLIAQPDMLLLDEPSNFLDLPAVEWLQRFLKEYQGTLLLISHDRFLLRSLTTITLEVAAGKAVRYAGDYNYYLQERENRYVQQLAAWKTQQERRRDVERFIERFRSKATKATQVQSRIKMLEKMDVIDEPVALKHRSLIRIAPPPHSGHELLRLEAIGHAYEADQFIMKDVSFSLHKGDRAALIGYNGMGKTTLLRVISGFMDPTRGKRVLGHQAVTGYQSQEYAETMPPEDQILDIVWSVKPRATQSEVRGVLGGFGFVGDDVYKLCKVLSGGEKIRLAFARLFLNPPNLLILDEPTTHLDIDGRCALEEALQAYAGTVVLVSHDVDFVRKTATRIIAMKPGGVDVVDGDYDYFFRLRGGMEGPAVEAKVNSRKAGGQSRKEQQAEIRSYKKSFRSAEKVIERLEAEQAELVASLSSEGGVDYQTVNRRLEDLQGELTAAQAEWEGAYTWLEMQEAQM